MGDEWPEEPGEPDPEERWNSPEEELPDPPEVTPPSPDLDETDVDPELLTTWWRSVALANVALGGVAVGVMLVGFRRMWLVGGASVVVGVLAAVRLYQHYRAFRERRDDTGEGTEDND